jgi:DNA polymerase-3 subunit epsilon
MLILVYDTETTGLPLWEQPSDDPRQPHIVQVAALLVDEATRKEVASINLTVRAEEWEIPSDVAAVHGITRARSCEIGVPEDVALDALLGLWRVSQLRVGHNESFDARIVRIAIKRYVGEAMADSWKAGVAACTGKLAAPIMKLPPTEAMRATGRNWPKMPKLTEAYQFFMGKPLDGGHDAMTDARACANVYQAIQAAS